MISLNQFNIKRASETKTVGDFEIAPLPKGYAHTFGTFLRRVLLSSIPGSAITSVKIDGVQHEYSTISGLKDDILTVILSLKNVVLVNKTEEVQILKISVKGKKGEVVQVKASDIEKNQNVEIINPDYVITELTSEKAKFAAEITVERGVGYRLPDETLRKEMGVLPIDASFSPVKLVNYSVSLARVGKETELDQLNLHIETNGAVTPIEALNVATDLLNQVTTHAFELTKALLKGGEVTVELANQKKFEETKSALLGEKRSIQSMRVSDANLSTRLTNCLLRAGVNDLSEFEGMTEEELAGIKGMGSKSLEELLAVLKKLGVRVI